MTPTTLALVAAAVLAAVHLLGDRLGGLDVVPRSAVLSAGSGVSVAYVFVHLLPEVARVEDELGELVTTGPLRYLEHHAWLLALAGLVVFYGLELLARRVRGGPPTTGPTPDLVGWVHVASYSLYNALVGVLLVERAHEATAALVLFAIAMGLHMLVNDHGLRADHGRLYRDRGRWLVASAVVAGWALGALTGVTTAVLGMLLAFLAGGVVMNVLKEELPEDRESRWGPFVAATVAYAALLLLL